MFLRYCLLTIIIVIVSPCRTRRQASQRNHGLQARDSTPLKFGYNILYRMIRKTPLIIQRVLKFMNTLF